MSGEGFKQSFRIGVLLFEQDDRKLEFMAEILFGLNEAGCTPFILSASLSELGMDVNRVASLVGETNADAWLVIAGSKEVLSWFANQRLPTFALFGRWGDSSIAGAGPSKAEAYREATQKLLACGHQRIVLLARSQRKLPQPGLPERAYLSALEEGGIEVSDFHFPLWKFERGLLQVFGLALQGDSADGAHCSGVQSIWSGGTVFGNSRGPCAG
jgi:DNA-binding LacI/PurR family transcriptional regulator